MESKVNWMQQGWECPKCGAVMSPHTDCCVNCRGNMGGGIATTTNPADINTKWTGDDPVFNDPSSICSTSGPLNPPYVLKTQGSHDEWWQKAQLNGYKEANYGTN